MHCHYRPRGPRSGPGCPVPVRHHLIGLIRPTRRHIAISPHCGLSAMPSLCGSAEATREWFRAFTAHSFLACRPLRPRGVRHRYPDIRCRHWPSPIDHRLGTPGASRNPFHAGGRFRGFTGSLPLQPARLLAPLYGSDWNAQPSGTFTSRLSTGRSPSPLLDITTTATDSSVGGNYHPLEWQLASLHGQTLPKRDVRVTSVYPSIAGMTLQRRERRKVPFSDLCAANKLVSGALVQAAVLLINHIAPGSRTLAPSA